MFNHRKIVSMLAVACITAASPVGLQWTENVLSPVSAAALARNGEKGNGDKGDGAAGDKAPDKNVRSRDKAKEKTKQVSPGTFGELRKVAIEIIHRNGMREQIRSGRYEMKDARGRRIIERRATSSDIARLLAGGG